MNQPQLATGQIVFVAPEPVLDFGNGFKINLNNERWRSQGFRCGICASSGSGKSHLVGVMHECLTDLGIPWVLIDPEGEYRGLGELPNVNMASRNGPHIHLNLSNLDWVTQILDCLDAGQGVIVDIYRLSLEARFEVYTTLLTQLLDHQQARREAGEVQAMILTVEETHIFAPQKRVKSKAALDITVEIAQRGRKAGINTIFVTQRPHALEKDVLSQTNIRFIGRLEEDNDFEAVESILPKKFIMDNGKLERLTVQTLQALGTGCFFVRIGVDFHRLAPARLRRTRDLAATPAFQPVLL